MSSAPTGGHTPGPGQVAGVTHAPVYEVYRTILRSRGVLHLPSVHRMSGDLDRTRPIWRQIAAAITARIEDGTYPSGSRVPSVVEIATEWDVAASTAQKVLAYLKTEGLVRSEIGLGTFVADRPGA